MSAIAVWVVGAAILAAVDMFKYEAEIEDAALLAAVWPIAWLGLLFYLVIGLAGIVVKHVSKMVQS